MKQTLLVLTLIFATLTIVVEMGYYYRGLHRPGPSVAAERVAIVSPSVPRKLARYSTVPDFSLTDRTGAPVTLADLKGKVWLAAFIYTTCPDTCPMLSSRLADWQNEVLACGDLRLVSFSVDPDHDTPAVLQAYAKRFHAADRWLFLTGDKMQLAKIAREGFLAAFARPPKAADGGGITHSTRIALVDGTGAVRRFYDGVGTDERAQVLADVKTLLKENPAR